MKIITPTSPPTPTPPFPVRFMVAKLGIDTAIEPVGNDNTGTMLLPQEADKVGWYFSGYKPGEKGNAVIGGHLDLATGAPAIFYSLKELTIGDTIEVTDEFNVQRIFKVTQIQSYAYDEMPMQSIFGNSDTIHLNLITCDGFFDQTKQIYSRRLVIYSDLVK